MGAVVELGTDVHTDTAALDVGTVADEFLTVPQRGVEDMVVVGCTLVRQAGASTTDQEVVGTADPGTDTDDQDMGTGMDRHHRAVAGTPVASMPRL